VGRLADVLRNSEGDISFTTLDRVQQAFPRARFQSASDALVRIKLVRSAEEIAVMEKATAAGELAIEAMRAAARPGAIHKDVWLAMFTALTGATGETPSRLAVRAGNEANTSTGGPMLEVLQAGQIMNQEIAGRVLGYMAQVNHSICIGSPPPPDWLSAAQYCVDVFHELVDSIKPGQRFMDLCQRYVERAKARSPELSPTWVLVHTCGFGDGPRMGYTRSETTDLVIEPSMLFTLKPRIPIKGTRPAAQFGDPVLVTANGARRLGKRKLAPVAAGVS
jgi:Xaa-Pro aminopeptidase